MARNRSVNGTGKKRKGLTIGITAAVVGVGIAAALGYFAFTTSSVPQAAKHISYETSPEEACKVFKESSLGCEIKWQVDDKVSRGDIISQSVKAQERVEKDTKVVLTYSNGPAESEFPNLNNVSLDEAKKQLYALNIAIKEIKEIDGAGIAEGNVVKSSIEAGKKVKNGTETTLEVSTGKVTIPNWADKTKEFVSADADKLGLKVKFTEEESEKASGIVISQTPKAGQVTTNSEVSVVVAKSFQSKDIKVPDVIGKSAEEAQTTLATAGFRHIKTVEVTNSEVTSVQVTQVVPGVGQTAKSEDNVVIIVSKPQK